MLTTAPPRAITMRSTDATWTAQDWEHLPDDGNRYEIIDGVLYMSTAPSLFHQWITTRIMAVFEQQLVRTNVAYVFPAPVGVFMPGCDPVQPDIVVVPIANQQILRDKRVWGVPALLIEILSPSNAAVDEDTKRAAYARAGVPEYWIVRPATRDVIVSTDPHPTGQYGNVLTIPPDGELISPILPVRTPAAALFSGAPDTTL